MLIAIRSNKMYCAFPVTKAIMHIKMEEKVTDSFVFQYAVEKNTGIVCINEINNIVSVTIIPTCKFQI